MKKQEQINTIVKCFLLVDIIEQYMTDLKPYVKQETKQELNRIIKSTRKIIKTVDSNFKPENINKFGEVADEIRENLDIIFDN